MFRNMKILTKFQLLMFGTVIGLSAILIAVTFSEVRSGIESFAAEKAGSDLNLAYHYLDERFDGQWQIQNGELYKGDHRINEDYELADEIADMTGGLVTIFQGRQPVTTNLIINDERAVTVEAEGEVTELVLGEGEMYYGDADILGTELQTAYRPVFSADGEIVGMLFTAASQEVINSIMSEIITMIIIILAVILGLIAVLLIFFTRKIKSRIQMLQDSLHRAGQGDFRADSREETRNDEIGQISASFSKMKDNLSGLLQNVTFASEQLASSSEELTATSDQSAKAAEEVAQTIEDISKGASDQAADTEKGAEEVNDLGAIIEQDQAYVESLNGIAAEMAALKDKGMALAAELVEKTTANNNVTEDVHRIISETNENTEKIDSASGMIKSISEQTNLLALNASIEAARAGEAGKGFSVVAEEIRKLAEQSNKFSEEISGIIHTLGEKTDKAADKMEESKEMARIQSESVSHTTSTFKGVAEAIERMRATLKELSDSGVHLNGKKEEIIRVMENLSAISEENAASTQEISAAVEEQTASMEEIASSSETLAKLAEDLQENASKFQY
ncbi:methyl-accepting chemotaxis protein [Salipaludibacillus aurantiacus]|uniref:Methyl-accepting chemotaxis protein n=2 Tax=Salipaludibacillus aurantiacus TaxID=1601833 RepID=A0A1H9W9M1_9BACI|nr:methyl-accepting chemotaxis protein [Salipaludibacillus aurantiacus]